MSHNLINLVKRDLTFIYKQLAIFYIIVLGCMFIAKITDFSDPPFWLRFIHELTKGAAFGFSVGAMINATIRTWARFRNNLYGDESYLTHTLPISKNILWASKFITSVIVIVLSIIVVGIALSILSPDLFRMLSLSQDAYPFNTWLIAAEFVFVVMLQFIYIMQAGYLGIILGHRRNNHRLAASIAFGIAFYLLAGIILIAFCLIFTFSDYNVRQLFFKGVIDYNGDCFKLLTGIGTVYLILIGTSYLIGQKLLNQGVNVD